MMRPFVIAVPHRSMEDDVYRELYIPAKSFIFPNTWSVFGKCSKNVESDDHLRQCLHNETDFPDPDIFNPDRFIGDSVLNSSKIDPRDFAFGYGRR